MSEMLHRPCARYPHEIPHGRERRGPESLRVELLSWAPKENLFPLMWNKLQAGAGDAPERFQPQLMLPLDDPENLYNEQLSLDSEIHQITGWHALDAKQRLSIEACFAGKLLPQPLEGIVFQWLIDGCSRVTTHQIVRTRIGAGFVQHSGRVNDWRHRDWSMPETIARACDDLDDQPESHFDSCITDPEPIRKFLRDHHDATVRGAISRYLQEGRLLYAALVDAGIPHQDARRVLTFGTTTYIYADYSYPAMAGLLSKRLEHTMEWEINCIAQLMVRELRMKTPRVFWQYLGSASDKARVNRTTDDSAEWSPDGKWPLPPGQEPPAHPSYQPNQNPYWVLHPSAMAGGPIRWVATNGTYPQDLRNWEEQRRTR